MAIVPSGRKRIMEAQSAFRNDPNQFGLDGLEDISVRDEVSQEPISPEIPEQELGQEQMDAEPVGRIGPEEEMEAGPEAEPGPQGGDAEANLRDHIFDSYEQLGIQKRMLMNDPEKFFKSTVNLADGTISGFFLIPTHTANKRIGESEARRLASDILGNFGLQGSMDSGGHNYKVSFKSRQSVDPNAGSTGSSFDHLLNTGGDQVPKAAATIGEMIKNSRNKFYDDIINKHLGETK